jgi:phosphoenolpyruvate carboxykinase (ATP)
MHQPSISEQLAQLGLQQPQRIHWNLSSSHLYEEIIRRNEGILAENGPLVVHTGAHTGRSADDKFIVCDEERNTEIFWGKHNKPMSPEAFDRLFARVAAYLQNREIFVQDCYAGIEAASQQTLRIITEHAWHSLFARNMFLLPQDHQPLRHSPDITVLQVPNFLADRDIDQTRSSTCIALHLGKKLALIVGTAYAGEIKKSVFTAINYLFPKRGILSMHCAANVGTQADTALFFGLSGTGKTSLSTAADKQLIGDDEVAWSDSGIFAIEGGCYAKMIRLSPETEPEIYATTKRFGTILENVVIHPESRALDLDNDSLTENTRGSYRREVLPNISPSGQGTHPRHIFFLTADAFGILPPIARLSNAQALYHFLSGYTAKVAGTELGIKEPRATFSTCFGAPFMPLHPTKYADLLAEKLRQSQARCWLINTGWTKGPYGFGERIALPLTRAMLRAALSGALDNVSYTIDPIFGVEVPSQVPDVPRELLQPRSTWSDPDAYDAKARELAVMFEKNFESYAGLVSEELRNAGPVKSSEPPQVAPCG